MVQQNAARNTQQRQALNHTTQQRSKERHLSLVKPQRGAGRCVEAATMGVTVAVEEARKRGEMSIYDAKHLSKAERAQYVRLCKAEWGIVEWTRGESPRDMQEEKSYSDMEQFDNLSFLER